MSIDDSFGRLKYIDNLFYWRKPFSQKCLQEKFSVTRQTVTRDLKEYAERYPSNRFTTKSIGRKKYYHASDSINAELADHNFTQFMVSYSGGRDNIQSSPTVGRRIQPSIVGPLLFAIEHKLRFESRYFSVSSGDTEQRVIQPHAIAEACGRFHVRAWCEKSQRFSDFVLAGC